MPTETISGLESLPDNLKNHIESLLNNPGELCDLDVSIFFVNLDMFLFHDVLRVLARNFKKVNNGKLPELNLVFVIDDLGDSQDKKRGNLRRLKALLEEGRHEYGIKSIVVKGTKREEVVDLEQNVFASGVRFEEL